MALALVLFSYRESFEHSRQKIDWWGAITLVGATVSLMFALEFGGKQYAWGSGVILGLFAAFTVLLIIAGFGFSFSILSMAPMHNLDARQRGTANSTMAFVRSLGMTVSITIYGVLQRNAFTNQLNDVFAGAGAGQAPQGDVMGDPRVLLSPEARMHIPKPVLEKITNALSSSIGQIFVWSLVPALLALVAVLCMSNERMTPDEGKAGKEAASAIGH